MADFAKWASACETALWPAGTFRTAFCGNRDETVEGVIEADPIATAVRTLMTTQREWTGTASELLGVFATIVDERTTRSKYWPDTAPAMAGRLRRVATFLREAKIEISFWRQGQARTRVINIRVNTSSPENITAQPSVPSASSAPSGTVLANTLKCNVKTDADGTDAKFTPLSEPVKRNSSRWRVRI